MGQQAASPLLELEHDILRALPQAQLPKRGEILPPFGDGEKMVSRELADL